MSRDEDRLRLFEMIAYRESLCYLLQWDDPSGDHPMRDEMIAEINELEAQITDLLNLIFFPNSRLN
jgi:hypothetical protein